MKKFNKKNFCAMVTSLVFIFSFFLLPLKETGIQVLAADTSSNSATQQPFTVLSSAALTSDMGAGWDLGNTMDGHTGFTPNETLWQTVKTTKALIKSIHDMGFNTVRIPVTWGTTIDDNDNYSIDEKWMSRVQDIVDYCISQDMYVIINIHHDGAEQSGWLRIATDDQAGLKKKFAGVWKTIATRFKDYDEHLIFESMNEVTGKDMSVYDQNQVIMSLNQIFVDTVRATGSNNAKRWLMVPGKYNQIASVTNSEYGFSMPTDKVKNRLILSVHDYSPWNFCGTVNSNGDVFTKMTLKQLNSNAEELEPLYEQYTSKGIPVVVGEYGCMNKDNSSERAYYLEGMNRIFKKYKLVGVYWDQGWYDRSEKPDYSFALVDRENGKPIDKTITDAIMRGRFSVSSSEDISTLTHDVTVIAATDIKLSKTALSLTVGNSSTVTATLLPETSNDVVLWKTADPTVATVAYGKINATGIGTTTITCFTQDSEISKEITVNVKAKSAATACTGMSFANQSLELTAGKYVYLDPVLTPSDTDETVYFRSSDESVATVSSIGKVLAISTGNAAITAETTGGISVTIPVTVKDAEIKQNVRLALNVYYNDSDKNYFSNEVSSDIVTFTGNGQYKLTFDCTKDLSKAAVKAGISDLNNITAIYIKDYDVTEGNATVSPLTNCSIRYDKIVVNGNTLLTIKNNDFKSAIKESGILDTNDPLNSWDGSAVSEVSVSKYVLRFTSVSKPTKITVYFTLDDVCFKNGTTDTSEPKMLSLANNDVVGKSEVTTTAGKPTGLTFRITSLSGKTLRVIGPDDSAKISASIPATVKVLVDGNYETFKVVSIGASAFKGCSLKSVTIGKNVKSIGKNAFLNCKSLKSVTFTGTAVPSIGALAFKNINAKAVFKVTSSKLSDFKKILTSKTGFISKSMTVKAK